MDIESTLLHQAAKGDESAFGRLVGPYRRELHAHCYRMLGSTHDAEDLTQETLLRAWRGLARFEGRSSVRTWLYRIATNACLDALASRSRRVLPIDLDAVPDAEPHWVEPYLEDPSVRYEHSESLELAFVAALQYLTAGQRASLLLCDVLGFSARDASEALDTTVASVTSALQRAREATRARLPEQSQQAALRSLGDDNVRHLVDRYMRALETADLDAMLALLTDDITWSMPPDPACVRGLPAVRMFLRDDVLPQSWRHIPMKVNGQAAVACYLLDHDAGRYAWCCADVLTFQGDRISAVTAFFDAGLAARAGLPEMLPAVGVS